jgi:hypothetical protein
VNIEPTYTATKTTASAQKTNAELRARCGFSIDGETGLAINGLNPIQSYKYDWHHQLQRAFGDCHPEQAFFAQQRTNCVGSSQSI